MSPILHRWKNESKNASMMMLLVQCWSWLMVASIAFAIELASATFHDVAPPTTKISFKLRSDMRSVALSLASSAQSDLEIFVSEDYPMFYSLLSLNEGLWKKLAETDGGCTLFAPSDAVFLRLGENKLLKLKDNRNLETAQKMGLYHVIVSEAVTAARLRTEDWTRPAPFDGGPRPITVQALVTMGGEVPVGRSKSGGIFLGIGAKEDGEVVIGSNARIVKSYKVDSSIVHEIDNMISPLILWRYCDQLRIPGF
jgi:uncharacterized surface protein with fasciclin (FAS1) repeats